jgi:hypothetical protein
MTTYFTRLYNLDYFRALSHYFIFSFFLYFIRFAFNMHTHHMRWETFFSYLNIKNNFWMRRRACWRTRNLIINRTLLWNLIIIIYKYIYHSISILMMLFVSQCSLSISLSQEMSIESVYKKYWKREREREQCEWTEQKMYRRRRRRRHCILRTL